MKDKTNGTLSLMSNKKKRKRKSKGAEVRSGEGILFGQVENQARRPNLNQKGA